TSDVPLTVATSAILSVGQAFTAQQPVTVTTNGVFRVTGGYTSLAPLALNSAGLLEVVGTFTSPTAVTVDGGVLSADRIEVPDLSALHGGVLTCPGSST